MFDKIDKLSGSLVQYGPHNDRVYLMKLEPGGLPELPTQLRELAARNGLSKILAKIPAQFRAPFDVTGYREEALVPRMLEGKRDVAFMSLYLDETRERELKPKRVLEVLEMAQTKRATRLEDFQEIPIVEQTQKNKREMAEVYRQVFASYPFPIHDPDYLAGTMESHIRYFGVREKGQIVALSSAEMDIESACVEMTDFATLAPARGRNLALQLLAKMEEAMHEQGNVSTAYTIARSLSPGMNITFAKAGYTFAGTLTNNTNISGDIESMNVWYKHLVSP